MTVLGHERGEDALAQAAIGHAQALARPHPEQRFEDGAAGKHEIGALMPDAGLRRALGIGHADEVARHGAHVAGAEPATVNARPLVERKLEVNPRNRGDRARGAEKVRAAAGDLRAEPVLVLELAHGRHDLFHHGLVMRGRHVPAAVALGEIDHADRQRRPGGDATLHVDPIVQRSPPGPSEPLEVEPDQLGAAAADIEHEREVGVAIDQRGAARHGELGLGLLRHDFDPEPSLGARPRDELRAVCGDAAGFGRNQPRARHAAAPHLVGAHFEGVDGSAHGRFRQPPRRQHAFAEANDAGEGVDDEKAAARRLGDEEPAIIGAEVERGVNGGRGRPRMRARIRLSLGCRLEAVCRRQRTRAGCVSRRRLSARAVAGLASPRLEAVRSHGSRAGIAARPTQISNP